MTGAGYRWTGSFGIFLGCVTTLLSLPAILPREILDLRLSFAVWFFASMLGVGVSLVSLFLHPDRPDRESPLNHRAVGYVAVALNAWPWPSLFWLGWFIRLGPPGNHFSPMQ
jgi:hypothetical protein